MRSRIYLVFSILLLTWLIPSGPAGASYLPPQQVTLIEASVEYIFGQSITFHGRIESDVPVASATVTYQPVGQQDPYIVPARVSPGEAGIYAVEYTDHLTDHPLQPFAQIEYRFGITLTDGRSFQSPPQTFNYNDDRFEWQMISEPPFSVHWYSGDIEFAQNVLAVSQESLQQIQTLIDVPRPAQIDVFLYANSSQMNAALNATHATLAGHADPDQGTMIVALPPGPEQRLLMEVRVPHELMHILLFRSTGTGYENLPTWINEGLASIAELYPNPDYQVLLTNAYRSETLIPMGDLCGSFPRDASKAQLAYAQAASFTRFIHTTFGVSGLQNLVSAYANGMDCQKGAENALGSSLAQLERQWRQDTFAENAAVAAINNLLPWLLLLGAALAAPVAIAFTHLRRPTHSEQPPNL